MGGERGREIKGEGEREKEKEREREKKERQKERERVASLVRRGCEVRMGAMIK